MAKLEIPLGSTYLRENSLFRIFSSLHLADVTLDLIAMPHSKIISLWSGLVVAKRE
jgi:hypothetical protein